jgi:putative FmdB family regulatory protein
MPIYEYECLSCKEIVEKIQKFSEAPLTSCPHCAGELKKLVSSSSFHLKGGGWYADGYSSTNGCAKAANGGGGKESCGSPSGTPSCGGCAC